jgi:hypothetical protein
MDGSNVWSSLFKLDASFKGEVGEFKFPANNNTNMEGMEPSELGAKICKLF